MLTPHNDNKRNTATTTTRGHTKKKFRDPRKLPLFLDHNLGYAMYEFAVIGDGGKQTSTLNVFGSSPAHALKRAKIMANPMRVYPLNATKPKAANDDGQPDVIKEAA